MSSSPPQHWLSSYLYYAEPWEPFLLNAVLPLASQLLEKQLINQYFFIRYWERGPHLRLRLQVNERSTDQIQEIVAAHFSDYLEHNPSERILTEEMKAAGVTKNWCNNNSILFEEYVPETNRYGGALALPLAPLQFFTSTQVVLEHLRHADPWTYDDALGVAIKLHLTFVKAIKLTREEAVLFFEMIFQNWLSRAIPAGAATANADRQKTAILSQFEKSYAVQKAAVLPYITSLWRDYDSSGSVNLPSMYHWWNTHQFIAEKLQNLENQSLLASRPPADRYQSISGLPDRQLDRWSIFADYLHMTNNRLGILNRDEPFLAYLLTQALRTMA